MKKTLALLLAFVMLLAFAACGDGKSNTEISETSEESVYSVGDTISGENFEVALTGIETADAFSNSSYKDKMRPAAKEDANGIDIIGTASDEYTFLLFEFNYKFIGKETFKDELDLSFAPTVKCGDYSFGGGYSFSNSYIVVTKHDDRKWAGLSFYNKGTDSKLFFDAYTNNVYMPLVTTDTKEARGAIVVPKSLLEMEEPIQFSFDCIDDYFTIPSID